MQELNLVPGSKKVSFLKVVLFNGTCVQLSFMYLLSLISISDKGQVLLVMFDIRPRLQLMIISLSTHFWSNSKTSEKNL